MTWSAHPQALGRPVGLGVLLGGRRRGRPPGGPAAGHRPPRLQPDRGVRPPRRRALRRRARAGPDAEPLHRVQPLHEVRPPARAGRAPRLRPPGHRPPRPGRPGATARPAPAPRGADAAKDQSYVLSMLGQDALARSLFPVGDMTKDEVRAPGPAPRAAHRGQARQPGRVLHRERRGAAGASCPGGWRCTRATWWTARAGPPGTVEAVELVTVGQRRGMGHGSDGQRRYVTRVDVAARRVTVGGAADGAALVGRARRRPRSPGSTGRSSPAPGRWHR